MLDLDRLGFAYDPGHWLFRGVSHRVAEGEVLTVLGPNGRGKTTLLRCLVGLASPTEGAVAVRAAGATGAVGFVPQQHHTAFAYRTLDMVLMGRTRHLGPLASPGRRDRGLALAAMERVGIGHLADRDYPTLSGGERQLVLLARAIAGDGRVLVLDEPAAALDLRNQGRVLHLLRGLADEGRSVVMTTHHPDHALEVADTAMLMFGGSDVRVGPAAELLTDAAVGELYGVRAHSLVLDAGGVSRRVLVTRFDQEVHP
ncbi:iron complex transport system ATP-binding protein [Nocardiopsis mwathae]|uniref:Iron complex transport system ATP-binding protein n=1 Tax=Nocardiopsis mwathae TaxID=1472723 RepID=A0A7X0D7K9_9ACTN|nr:ABC transporter ATP-binding protein [Nocardiopsis mwathae]MBB6174737.1 iron complex transport system ATP-binding protein [Nocardiopsis mwathae]